MMYCCGVMLPLPSPSTWEGYRAEVEEEGHRSEAVWQACRQVVEEVTHGVACFSCQSAISVPP